MNGILLSPSFPTLSGSGPSDTTIFLCLSGIHLLIALGISIVLFIIWTLLVKKRPVLFFRVVLFTLTGASMGLLLVGSFFILMNNIGKPTSETLAWPFIYCSVYLPIMTSLAFGLVGVLMVKDRDKINGEKK